VQEAPGSKVAADDDRTADADRHADDQRLRPVEAPEHANTKAGGDEDGHTQNAARDRSFLDVPYIDQIEAEPHAEHEEDDPYVGEGGDGLGVSVVADGEGAERDARDHVADERGDSDQACKEATCERNAEGYSKILE